jgi:Dynein, heavy chain
MTLFSALRALPDMEVVGLNFSSATTPELLLKTFDHYCEYRKTPNGVVLAPVQVKPLFLRINIVFNKMLYINIKGKPGKVK